MEEKDGKTKDKTEVYEGIVYACVACTVIKPICICRNLWSAAVVRQWIELGYNMAYNI